MRPMNIILTGFMGTGKSHVGKRLAKRLGWRFTDVDRLIEQAAGKAIPNIFSEHGERVFRRLERRCIARVVHGHQQVIATGGGAFVDPASRARLRVTGPVVCLTATPAAILARLQGRLQSRPMLAKSRRPLATITQLLKARARVYAQADLTVDTSRRTIEQVVDEIWRVLSPCLCKSWQYVLDRTPGLARKYGGKYVVVADDRVVACGNTQLQAYRNAGRARGRGGDGDTGIYYIPLPEESLTALPVS